MPKVIYTQPDGTERVIEGTAGDSVMRTAVRNGVSGIVGQCGGVLSCATCHVFLDEAHADDFPPPGEDEDDMLDGAATERRPNSRLSCQLKLAAWQEVRVTIPESQL
ncbi:ferredoxin [Trebonia kvetii]|uniref:Ferredoxin n=1 Tax=Trebonia kvetii TaxID=2480626 RepID=A0A6P2BTI2_9ACTN|nr:2Fe-2S iron-sulfur cluster-binding protein [Trebonia kvetii]TVZ02208.1 ferredoxin [Trebonia kvetii]